MGRLFYGVTPAEPRCSACGLPSPKYYDGDNIEIRFCDEDCFVEYFIINEAEDYARGIAEDRMFEEVD